MVALCDGDVSLACGNVITAVIAHFFTFLESTLPTSSTKIAENHSAVIFDLGSATSSSISEGGSRGSSAAETKRPKDREQII